MKAKRKMVLCDCAHLCNMGTSEMPPIMGLQRHGLHSCNRPVPADHPMRVMTCGIHQAHMGTFYVKQVEVQDG
jgi:hypothetical protein